jgi:NADP-dependent 3-hydroxy acid dehydrogenase YdfG
MGHQTVNKSSNLETDFSGKETAVITGASGGIGKNTT